MGEAKRRQENLGEDYGKNPYILPWLPVTQKQLQRVYEIVMKGSWIGIFIVVASWVIVRFIGPSLGWWELVPSAGA